MSNNEEFKQLPFNLVHLDAKNFRTVLNPDKLTELTESVKLKGIIEPLIVRPLYAKGEGRGAIAQETGEYIVVSGERRYRAGENAELSELPCLVRYLTEAEAEEIQMHENLHREDLTPMDEARMYLRFQQKDKNLEEISKIAGKNIKYIRDRLKLNDLIPEFQDDVIAENLPLSHAYILCEFNAEAQEKAKEKLYNAVWVKNKAEEREGEGARGEEAQINCPECGSIDVTEGGDLVYQCLAPGCEYEFDEYDVAEDDDGEGDETQGHYEFDKSQGVKINSQSLHNWFDNNYMLNLNKAIFPLDATNLHPKQLACILCPENTGAQGALFGTTESICLNRPCYESKRLAFVQIERAKIAKKLKKKIEEVPIIAVGWSDAPEGQVARNARKKLDLDLEKERQRWENGPDNTCDFMQTAINLEDGQIETVCLESTNCQEHHKRYSSESKPVDAEEEALKKRLRKEEIWDCKVAEVVRLKVITQAAKTFSDEGREVRQTLIENLPPFTARLWQNVDYNQRKHVKRFLSAIGIELPETVANDDYEFALSEMVETVQLQFGFILAHYWKGDCSNGSFNSQYQIKAIAEEWNINYLLIDAEVRHELAPKKHEKIHSAYLQKIQVNDLESARVPRVHEPSYVPKGETLIPIENNNSEPTNTGDELQAPEAIETLMVGKESPETENEATEAGIEQSETVTEQSELELSRKDIHERFSNDVSNLGLTESAFETFNCMSCDRVTTMEESITGILCPECDGGDEDQSAEVEEESQFDEHWTPHHDNRDSDEPESAPAPIKMPETPLDADALADVFKI